MIRRIAAVVLACGSLASCSDPVCIGTGGVGLAVTVRSSTGEDLADRALVTVVSLDSPTDSASGRVTGPTAPGQTNPVLVAYHPGRYRVRVVVSGYSTFEQVVAVAADPDPCGRSVLTTQVTAILSAQ